MLKKTIDGVIEVCCHRISYWWDMDGVEIDPAEYSDEEVRERLQEEAESRAKTCLTDGCSSGELCCVIGETELHGWWGIEKED